MNKDMAWRWVAKADRDFSLATQLDETFSNMAAYHYQQARHPNEEEIDFPDPLELRDAQKFFQAARIK